jgi:ABC-2 type transport system ATP-binding protein
MEFAIETTGLTKSFGDLKAVDGVSLKVRPGEIYGFLGLNGAGKTTTIRMLLGMIRPSAGSACVLGEAVGPHGSGPWGRVGHMVESPAAYPELTVRENLELARRLHMVPDPSVVDRAIEGLGLGHYERIKAGTLSTGNLQRLGLARALLHSPDVLILDEPANGLDPAGVVEIRELIKSVARDHGVTVFMSSHILSEVDRLASRIGIIHGGRLLEELDADKLERLRARYLEVRTRSIDGARGALLQAGFNPAMLADRASLRLDEQRALDAPDQVASILAQAGMPPIHLALVQEDLEQYFLRLTTPAGSKPA